MLVELFTSQGCSSCPPADRLLGELAQRADVVALAFHVTYWDRLGWPDSFGQPAWTDRQRAYAASLGTGGLYTPQMVVAGRLDVVGSDRSRVLAAVDLAREQRARGPDHLHGRPGAPAGPDARAAGAAAAGGRSRRGPTWRSGAARIAGARGLPPVVRSLTDLGPWDGGARVLSLPSLAGGRRRLGLIAQDTGTGEVVALGQLTQ